MGNLTKSDHCRGGVYLLHFFDKIDHAQHYLGYSTNDYKKRIDQHISGKGSGLVKAAVDRGFDVILACVRRGMDGDFERLLKKQKKSRLFCPICRRNTGLKPYKGRFDHLREVV